jgi:hypothetical protein
MAHLKHSMQFVGQFVRISRNYYNCTPIFDSNEPEFALGPNIVQIAILFKG